MFGIRRLFDNSGAKKISELEADIELRKRDNQNLANRLTKQREGNEKLKEYKIKIVALKDELDTLDITLRAESTKLLATTSHLYRVQQLTWWQRVAMAIFKPESLWRV